ncbi:hypothetical protein BpHYR1_037762 [Brachionus plicatilis]|uniref:SWIM-type domain-containing protein n=1 Tax=Brachionus plicatilis TaxID=10195 RepID=A0A3M7RA50_BRAPC|nr:hypothetical protein BpHYR1_037762 [Brachionus plicatilis]
MVSMVLVPYGINPNFDIVPRQTNSLYEITINKTQWKLSRCSCYWNSKNYICKHVIGVCSKLKIGDCQIPIASVNKPLGKKRSRGKPTLAAAALVVDSTGFKKA